MTKLILFGSEIVGKDALHFFGNNNVECFCDNNPNNIGKIVEGKKVISFQELETDFRKFFVVIATSRNSVYAISKQLSDAGIHHCVPYLELKKWISGNVTVNEFLTIWTSKEKYEELRTRVEMYSEIYRLKEQVNFFKEHVDITTLLPAKGELRKTQDRFVEVAEIFDTFARQNGIDVFLESGNLIGAVRHRGFVPWDDDFDFGLMRSDFYKLENKLREEGHLFLSDTLVDYTLVSLAELVEKNPNTIIGYRKEDTMKIYYGTCLEDMIGLDLWVYDYFNDNCTIDQYDDFLNELIEKKSSCKSIREKVVLVDRSIENCEYISLSPTNKIHMGPEYLLQFPVYRKKDWINADNIFPLVQMKYENTFFKGPKNADFMLKFEYQDYMAFPDDVGVGTHR